MRKAMRSLPASRLLLPLLTLVVLRQGLGCDAASGSGAGSPRAAGGHLPRGEGAATGGTPLGVGSGPATGGKASGTGGSSPLGGTATNAGGAGGAGDAPASGGTTSGLGGTTVMGGTTAAGGTTLGGSPATGGAGGDLECPQATGDDYQVSVTGSDSTGDGSDGAPWRTLAHALTQVPADQGHAIRLSPGVFDEAKVLTIPSGVSVIGAGSDATTVRVDHRFDFTQHGASCDGAADTSYDNHHEHFVVQMDGSDQCVSGFFLQGIREGESRQNHGGIFANWAKNVTFSGLRIEDFVFAGLWVHNSEDTEVRHSVLRNNAWYNNATDTGDLLFHANTRLRIHHNLIEETHPGRGPYGIKAYAARWSNFCWWQWWTENWTDYADGMEITDNTIRVPEMAGWTTGGNSVPGIAIEFNGISMRNVLIARNHLNNVVSLVGSYNNDGYEFWSARVVNNWFELGTEYRYAVEANVPGLEFAYNFVDGGLYPLAQWETGRDRFQRQSIHHNVFHAQQGGQALVQYSQGLSDLEFSYNTVVDTRGISALFAGATHSGTVRGNVLVAPGSRADIIGSFRGTIDHNLFFNIPAAGAAAVTGDPLFHASGPRPYPWFALGAGSPAIDAGVVAAGITDGAIGAPDLGAFESGATAWTVGPAP